MSSRSAARHRITPPVAPTIVPSADEPYTVIETITPALAVQYLTKNTDNRRFFKQTAENYADDMRDGKWQINNDAICFGKNGSLLNGQHRLTGVIMADMPIKFQVTRNMDESAFMTMDTQRKRTASDVFGIMKIDQSPKLAAIMRIVMNYRDGEQINHPRSHSAIIAAYETEPSIANFVETVGLAEKRFRSVAGSAACYIAYHFGGEQTKVQEFIDGVKSGTLMADNDPRWVLREKMRDLVNPSPNHVWGNTVKALNYYIKGKTLKTITPEYDGRVSEGGKKFVAFSEITCAPRKVVSRDWGK